MEPGLSKHAVDRLLDNLHDILPDLPKSHKSLFPRSKKYETAKLNHGNFVYINDWADSMESFLEKALDNEMGIGRNLRTIHLCVNMDGVDIFRSPSRSAISFLVNILEMPEKVFCAGIYVPNNIKEFKFDICDITEKFVSQLHTVNWGDFATRGEFAQNFIY